MTLPIINDTEIATEVILWKSRYQKGWISLDSTSVFSREFENHLLQHRPKAHLEAVQHAIEQFFLNRRTLGEWWLAVLKTSGIRLMVFDQRPHIPLNAIRAWRKATARLDHDALITLELASRDSALAPRDDALHVRKTLQDLQQWRVLPGLWSRELQSLCQRGLADTHVHLEACDPIPLLWARLMMEDLRIDRIPRYQDRVLDGIRANEDHYQKRLSERNLIERAKKFRMEQEQQLINNGSLRPLSREDSNDKILCQERSFLLLSWIRILNFQKKSTKISLLKDDKMTNTQDDIFLKEFDCYLVAKSIFHSEHQQFPGSSAGLRRFREYFDRGRADEEKQRVDRSPRALRSRFERLGNYAMECPDLKALELRISPCESLEKWSQLLRVWDTAMARRDKLQGQPSLIVHFIRKGRPNRPDIQEQLRFRRTLDGFSAVLHLFRHRYPDLAQWIVGLDVANLERGSPPHVFIPYFKLLRGDVSELESPGYRRQPQPKWEYLKSQNLHRHSFKLPRLGATYHVGEDFYHLVTGLRHIDQLADYFLEERDRIGHALALGLDPEAWFAQRGSYLGVPQGVLLDDMVWLRKILLANGALDNRTTADLERGIAILTRKIYGRSIEAVVMEDLGQQRTLLPPAEDVQVDAADTALRCYHREVWDPEVVGNRWQFAERDDIGHLNKHIALVRDAQRIVCQKLSRKRIFIEINPTSNIATSALGRYADHPLFFIHEATQGKARITVNTDDPGTFATRIDQEYAMLLDAMLNDLKMELPEAMDFLENLRATTLESSFCHARTAPG